jgi:hypothetical protein
MYTNMPIVDENRKQPYSDTPKPKVFGNVSPFDPQLFASANEDPGPKISSSEVAAWLSSIANQARAAMAKVPISKTAEYRRWQEDVQILSGLGLFYSRKFSAATRWHAFEQTRSQLELQLAIEQYSMARNDWAEFATLAKEAYSNDITYGTVRHMRGHWLDRLPDIDGDIEDMKKHLAPGPHQTHLRLDEKVFLLSHTPPANFQPGKDLEIIAKGPATRLFYRHVNQAERWRVTETKSRGYGTAVAIIPAAYTASKFNLQYYFSALDVLYPGFGEDHSQTPYFVVRS